MRRRTIVAWCARLGLVAVISLAAAGCGGGGGGGSRLSETEFRDRAEAICRQIEQTDVPQPTGPSDVERYMKEFSEVLDQSAREFHALQPPENLQGQWDEYLRLVDEGIDAVHQFRDRVDELAASELPSVAQEYEAQVTELADRGHAIERNLGLDECVT